MASFAAAVCVGLIVQIIATAALSEYRASATLLIEDDPPSRSDLRGPIYDAVRRSVTEAHVAELRSGTLIGQIIERFDLGSRLDIAAVAPPTGRAAEVFKAVRDRLEVTAGGREVQVLFKANDPALAIAIVNDLVSAYVEVLRHRLELREAKESQLRQEALVWAEELEAAAERRLNMIRAAHSVAAPVEDVDRRTLSEEIEKLERSRADDERKAAEIRAAIAEGRAERIVTAQSAPVVRQLFEVKAHILDQSEKLSKTLLPNHPRRLELASDLAGIDRQLAMHAAEAAVQLDQSAVAAKHAEAQLRAKLNGLRQAQPASLPDLASVRAAERELTMRREAVQTLRASDEQSPADLPIRVKLASTAVVSLSVKSRIISTAVGIIAFAISAAVVLVAVSDRKRSAKSHPHSAASGLA